MVGAVVFTGLVWRLRGSGETADYETAAEAHGDERLAVELPFPVELVPRALVER